MLFKLTTSLCKCGKIYKTLISKYANLRESLWQQFYLKLKKAITILNFLEMKVNISSKDKRKKE